MLWDRGRNFPPRLFVCARRIIYEDLPDPDMIMLLCDDIYMARESGDLVLEEMLFRELIMLYRDPAAIIEWTKGNKQD